jgi:hypothetical protein
VRLDSAHFCSPLDSQKIQLFGVLFFYAGFGLRWIRKKIQPAVRWSVFFRARFALPPLDFQQRSTKMKMVDDTNLPLGKFRVV